RGWVITGSGYTLPYKKREFGTSLLMSVTHVVILCSPIGREDFCGHRQRTARKQTCCLLGQKILHKLGELGSEIEKTGLLPAHSTPPGSSKHASIHMAISAKD